MGNAPEGDQAAASTRDERDQKALSPGGPRKPNRPSGQVAAPPHWTARVRFGFAGRAHRREFTPKLEIKRKENKVKEKEEIGEKKRRRLLLFGEEHVAGRDVATTAIVEIEDEIVFEDEILGGVTEFPRGAVDGVARAFEFDEGANGGFIEFNEKILGPGVARGEFVRGAEFFVAEPAAEA